MRLRNIIAAVLAICVASGCKGQTNNQKSDKMSKSIVIFFSHAGDNYSVGDIKVGNTKIVADYITDIIGADQFEIVTHKYDGMSYSKLIELAKKEAADGELPPYEGKAPADQKSKSGSNLFKKRRKGKRPLCGVFLPLHIGICL